MLVKSALKMRLRRSKIQKFSTQGKGTPLPLEPHPPQTRPFGTRRDPAPPGKKLVAPLSSKLNIIDPSII